MPAGRLTWDRLRRVPSTDVHPGDVLIALGMGTAYRFTRDGRVRGVESWVGEGPVPVDGKRWTVLAAHGDGTSTSRREDGVEATGRLPTTVLRLDGEPEQETRP